MNVGTCIHSNHSWKSFDSTFSQPLTWKLGQVEEIVWRVDKLHYGISTPPPPLHYYNFDTLCATTFAMHVLCLSFKPFFVTGSPHIIVGN